MKQEQVIELADKAVKTVMARQEGSPHIRFNAKELQDAWRDEFASLVEQATLERAAERFADTPAMEFFGYEVAGEIRHLAKGDQ